MITSARLVRVPSVKELKSWATLVAVMLGMGAPAFAQDEAGKTEGETENRPVLSPEQERARKLYQSIKWQDGPGTAELGQYAEIKLPEGYRFTGRDGARKWEELNQNPPSESILGVLMPADGHGWFIVFNYNDTGYVKDDEKDKIDADAIISSIRAGTEASNEMRRNQGWDEIKNISWQLPPSYDPSSHNLVWATTFEAAGSRTVNHSTRILGRHGVINANLVGDPSGIDAAMPTVKNLLAGLEYKSGMKYAEFKSGDKMAAYGLTALITGGAAAVAVKTGLLAKLGILFAKSAKLIVGGIAALIAIVFRTRKSSNG